MSDNYVKREILKHTFLSLLMVAALTMLVFSCVSLVRENSFKDINCSRFHTQEEARIEFLKHESDIYKLDTDKDMIPCESLPRKEGEQ